MSVFFYILVMAGVTYLIRMLPMIIFKKKIQNRLIRSFLYYIPYAVLAAMTFPAILDSTASPISAAVGLLAALVIAWFDWGLLPTALIACAGVFLCEWMMKFI
ncbi:MAG: AzlD domain-containing protein [Clostridia bacterium]|nr:AzlD domain-containing protein [Clostridia bacterium]